MNLLTEKDHRLHESCQDFDFEKGVTLSTGETLNASELFALLRDAMCDNRGVGLSACQLGIMSRVFVIGNPSEPETVIPVFNPVIVNRSDETEEYEEGCLSYPGLYLRIKRPRTIRVRYTNHEGITNTINFDGFTSRVFQHEYDHMDGVTFQSHVNWRALERAQNQKRKLNKLRQKKSQVVHSI